MWSKIVHFYKNVKWMSKLVGLQTCLRVFKWVLMMSSSSKSMFLLHACVNTCRYVCACEFITGCSHCLRVHSAYTTSYISKKNINLKVHTCTVIIFEVIVRKNWYGLRRMIICMVTDLLLWLKPQYDTHSNSFFLIDIGFNEIDISTRKH